MKMKLEDLKVKSFVTMGRKQAAGIVGGTYVTLILNQTLCCNTAGGEECAFTANGCTNHRVVCVDGPADE